MESPNNRGNKAPTRHHLPPNETSRAGLYLIELLANGAWKPHVESLRPTWAR